MYELLIALIIVLFALVKGREHFGLVLGSKNWDRLYTTNTEVEDGVEIVSFYPHTCPPDKPDLDAGLCYPRCKNGFTGVGPVCWADSTSIGVGIPVGLNPCPSGWSNDGLICREPIKNDCTWRWLGVCWGKLSGGRLRGRLNKYCPEKRRRAGDGYDTEPEDCRQDPEEENSPLYNKTMGVCEGPGALSDDHPDYIAGLCYRKCPEDLPEHIPGMPYLCYKGDGLAYGRGVGRIPPMMRFGRVFSPF